MTPVKQVKKRFNWAGRDDDGREEERRGDDGGGWQWSEERGQEKNQSYWLF